MKKIVLLGLSVLSLMAWDCTTDKDSVTEATGGKSIEMFCRNVSVLLTADYSDRARIQLGYGYSQTNETAMKEFSKVIMEQSEQCYSTCEKSLYSLKK